MNSLIIIIILYYFPVAVVNLISHTHSHTVPFKIKTIIAKSLCQAKMKTNKTSSNATHRESETMIGSSLSVISTGNWEIKRRRKRRTQFHINH